MSNGNGNGAETAILHSLEQQAQPGDVILQGVRFTDPKNGDVEADFLVLMPGLGVAVLEVKGGLVTYSDGEWRLRGISDPSYQRRIHPVDQARKAKHALRRYLDRQPEWNLGLVRSAWFVVMPETEVVGDFGPEGLREHLLGSGQVRSLRNSMTAVLDRGLLTEPRPTPDDVEDAISLLFRANDVSIRHMERPQGQAKKRYRRAWLGAAAGALALGGLGLGIWSVTESTLTEECSANYEPCLPVTDDLNCSDVEYQVRVVGADEYNLDRDGNGIGCESNPEAPAQP